LIGKEKIVVDFKDVKIRVGTQSAIESMILFEEYNETSILSLIKWFSIRDYNFIDIGANIGLHSLIASRANNKIDIFSFEPEPNNFYDFINNISLNNNKNIKPFSLGLGNSEGIFTMSLNEGWNKGKHSLKVDFKSKKIKIPVKKLDSFKENIQKGLYVIKIDVEGLEKEVVNGALCILKALDEALVIIELLEETNSSDDCREIINLFQDLRFDTSFMINENEFVKTSSYQGSADYIFIKGAETLQMCEKFILKKESL
jgi:FkbM family methyltransferase